MYLSIGYEADKHMSIINGKHTALTQFKPMFLFCTPWKEDIVLKWVLLLNLFKVFKGTRVICSTHIETSQLIFNANQLTGLYMGGTRYSYKCNVKFECI